MVLAVDDSRSMAENGCGGVALESLSLITKAMSRLEVGQVGVIKFGGADGVVPLQPLDAPFSDSVGPRLATALRFQGESTIADAPVAQLMAGLGHMLDVARHGVGSGGIGAGTQVRVVHVPVPETLALDQCGRLDSSPRPFCRQVGR